MAPLAGSGTLSPGVFQRAAPSGVSLSFLLLLPHKTEDFMFKMKTSGGVFFFTSDILGVKHAFSTRIGGVSTLPHTAELNISYTSGGDKGTDSADIITENRRRL